MPNKLRPDLPPLPPRIAKLPIDERGYPVPWFVQWLDENNQPTDNGVGRPEFRMASGKNFYMAMKAGVCWVCGEPLGGFRTFVLGPMCCITRTTSEPPSHFECADFSARACPFLTKPKMVRREDELTAESKRNVGGEMIERNPGVCALWTCKQYYQFADPSNKPLLRVGRPEDVKFYAQGRAATREEVEESVRTGLPLLEEACDGRKRDLADLSQAKAWFDRLLAEAFMAKPCFKCVPSPPELRVNDKGTKPKPMR